MNSPKQDLDQSNALEEKVRNYYDDNTKLFLKLGADGGTHSIHQPLYLKPDNSVTTAMHAQHDIILDLLTTRTNRTHVLDLGCGVGASMIYLAQRSPEYITFTGVTLSPRQAAIGRQVIIQKGLEDRIRILEGSFQDLPAETGEAHLAYAIESLIHATHLSSVFTQLAAHLAADGQLIVFDDFLKREASDRRESIILHRFRKGWQGYGLTSIPEMEQLARKHGFSLMEMTDYSGTLRLNRLRDRLVRLISPVAHLLAGFSAYSTFLMGGNARQAAYRRGMMHYAQVVLARG